VTRARGHSAEPLWRALAVHRFASIGYAVLLLVIRQADYSRPDLAWVVIAVMLLLAGNRVELVR